MLKTKPSIIASAVLLSLGLSACGGSSNSSTPAPTPTPTNSAPTAIALSATEVAENAVAATVGTLSTTDADSGDTFTYTVDDERFEISGSELKLKADTSFNYEMVRSVPVKVTVKDSGNAEFTQDFTITITDSMGVQSVLDALDVKDEDTYAFESKFEAGESAVSHTGQAARQILILELNNYIGNGLQADVDADKFADAAAVKAKLMSFYAKSAEDWQSDIDNGTELVISAVSIEAPLTAKQVKITDVSSSHKNLQGKIAGNDKTGQHKDWETDLVGWNDKGSVSPNGVVEALFDQLAANVQKSIDDEVRKDIAGNNITKLYVNEDGTDIKQLVQKFLLGAVNFSQGTDDYLDNDVDGKGLKSSHEQDGTKTYTKVEHQFDEGFGYFGAAHNYNEYTDLEIRAKSGRDGWSKGYNDINADGKIDLAREINFSNSVNAAKRDVGSDGNTNATNLTKEAFDAFVKGRKILNVAAGRELTADEMSTLLEQRDTAVLAWEKAISATVIHYINDTKGDLDKIGTDGYSADDFANLAKHWSELKGFSLNLQFNPFSPVTDEQFAMMQEKIGMKPVVAADEIAAYKTKLDEVRTMLQNAYHFDAENVEKW